MLNRIFNRKKGKPTLHEELNRELMALGSSLRVTGNSISWRNRKCQLFANYIDFWENGIKWYGIDNVSDIQTKARLVYFWVEKCLSSEEIESMIPDVHFPQGRKRIEQGTDDFLDWYWDNMVNKNDRRFGKIIELFASNERTRNLMSYIQSRDFGLSRSIGEVNGVFYNDLPFIRITDDWQYEVRIPRMSIIGKDSDESPREFIVRGTAEDVFETILNYLPENLGTAKYFICDGCPSSPAA